MKKTDDYSTWRQYLEYKAHNLDIKNTANSFLPSRYWFESVKLSRITDITKKYQIV